MLVSVGRFHRNTEMYQLHGQAAGAYILHVNRIFLTSELVVAV